MGLIQKIRDTFGMGSHPSKLPSSDTFPKTTPATKLASAYGYGSGVYNYGGSSAGAKWPYGLSASGRGRVLNHLMLRRNARDAYHDTPQARALIERYADTVADSGLMLEAVPKFNILGISAEAAEAWAFDIEQRFDSWARAKFQNRSGVMNWYQSHRLYQIFQHRDNDIFVRLYYSGERSLLNPLQFEFIDPDQVQGHGFTTTFGPQVPGDGITRDEQGREKSYRVWFQNPAKPGHYDFRDINRVGPRSKRLFMLHGFVPEYAGQGRGYSKLSQAIQEFENLTDFSAAQIKKAINQSSIMMYTKPSPDNPASHPFEDVLTNRGAGPTPSIYGSSPDPDDTGTTVDADPIVSYSALPEVTLDTPGSVGVFNLKEGEDLKAFDQTAPSDSYEAFVNAFTSYLAAANSMPLEVLLMKFEKNFSASRASLILFWRVACIWREEMAADYLNPIYEMWLSEEIAAGRVLAPGWADPRLKAAWLNSRWIGSPMPNIDPSKTAVADKAYIEMGAQTLDRVSRNLNGSSGAANRAKLAKELSELPPVPWSKGGASEGMNNGGGKDGND